MKWLWAALIAIIAETPAWAHALGAECKIKDGKVEVAAFFSDDTPAADAIVRITNGEKKVITSGRTNAAGKWLFAMPPPGRYQLLVDAGDGHRVTRSFQITADTRIAQGPGREFIATERPPDGLKKPPEAGSFSGAVIIDEGPTRQEFTSFPWLKLGIGLGAILAFTIAFVIARRVR